MADPTLAIEKTELDKLIALFLGYGVDSADWSAAEQADIDRARDAGTSKFYNERQWLFQEVTTTLTCVADDGDYDLPDGFGGVVEYFYFAADKGYAPIQIIDVGRIRQMITNTDASGVPRYAAVHPKADFDGSATQKWEVLLYPYPDQAYVLTYRYTLQRDALTDSFPYPAGGADHRQTLIEACLSEAESIFDDGQAVHASKYQEALARSFEIDKRYRPKNFGYNRDLSDYSGYGNRPIRYCTYNGSLPS